MQADVKGGRSLPMDSIKPKLRASLEKWENKIQKKVSQISQDVIQIRFI